MNETPAVISRLIAAGPADRSRNFCGCGFSVRKLIYDSPRESGVSEAIARNATTRTSLVTLLRPTSHPKNKQIGEKT